MKKIMFKTGAISFAQLIRREVGMPSGPPAEFGGSSFIASIIIESERVISVRNKSTSWVAYERKNGRVFNYRSLFRLSEQHIS